ncbi:MAG: FG-GAP-like repeat-containing protein, partial [Mucilaginibacter sp.]
QIPPAAAPVVTSFTPGSGAVGTAITVTGNNFNTSAAANIVYMGATQAKVTAAGATQLNITVPVSATYQPLSVLNTANHLTGYANTAFNTTFASKNSLSLTDLSSAVNFATTPSPYSVSVGDIDGDGKPDLVITNPGNNSISVYRNISVSGTITSSSFAAKVDFTLNRTPQKVIITDIDGDGKPDIIVSTIDPQNSVCILRNTAVAGTINSASFASAVNFAVPNASKMAISDMDGDGKPDIVLGNLTILLNNCSPGGISIGSFPQQALFSLGNDVKALTLYDINNDGKPDIIFSTTNGVSIVFNNSAIGNLSLSPKIDLKNSSGGSSIAVADIDSDGKADIITADPEYGYLHFERNISADNIINAGSFEAHVNFTANMAPYNSTGTSDYLLLTDIDGDGKPDVLTIGSGLNLVSIFRNISTANTPSYTFFDNKLDLNAGTNVTGFSAVDIDGDGKPDIVSVDQSSNTFSIFRNNPTPAPIITPPVITSISPASGTVGTAITIKGKNFNSVATGNIVYFGATKAVVNSATTGSLLVNVPVGANYESPSVLNTANGLTAYAPNKFITTFPSKNDITAQDFDPPVGVYSYPASFVQAADIDGDGKPDLIFHDGFQTVSVLRNLSASGTIIPAAFGAVGNLSSFRFPVGTDPQTIKVVDIDGDGKPDLLVTYYSFYGIGISVLLNRSTPGNIAFAPKVDIAYNSVPYGANTYIVETGDVDGDGKPDILIANSSLKGVSVLPNTSTPGKVSFISRYDFEAGRQSSSVKLADIDGDGKPELVISNLLDNTISILHNISSPGLINAASFEKHVDYACVTSPTDIVVGDLNADGKPDIIVVSTIYSPGICVLQNSSTVGTIKAASMAPKVDIVSAWHHGIAIADIDGDGKPDIVTDHTVIRNVTGTGNISGSFFAANDISIMPATTSFTAFCVDDVDGDGKPDIIGSDGNSITIVRNNPVTIGQPVISSFSPLFAATGDTVTLTGTNFIGVSSVTFGATPAASFKIIS